MPKWMKETQPDFISATKPLNPTDPPTFVPEVLPDDVSIPGSHCSGAWKRPFKAKPSIGFTPAEHPDRPTLLSELAAEKAKVKAICPNTKQHGNVNKRVFLLIAVFLLISTHYAYFHVYFSCLGGGRGSVQGGGSAKGRTGSCIPSNRPLHRLWSLRSQLPEGVVLSCTTEYPTAH